MPTAREQAGLVEAGRLLQEGLQLLEERSREVNALLEDARERALDIKAEAEQQAQQVVAAAEQRRTELEEQVAALQSEVAALREELVQLRTTRQGRSGRFLPAAAAAAAATPAAVAAAPAPPPAHSPAEPTDPTDPAEPAEASEAGEPPARVPLTEPEEPPHWGRRPSPGALAARKRPRWLPPWLPFIALMIVLGFAAANMVGIVGSSPGAAVAPAVIDVTGAPAQPTATRLALVAAALGQVTPPSAPTQPPAPTATQPPARAPTPAGAAAPTALSAGQTTPTPRAPLVRPTAPATVGSAPTQRPSLIAPVAQGTPPYPPLPGGDALRDGSIVAVYTSYLTYVVRPGDTVNQVAAQFGVTGDAIVRASGLSDANLVQPGQALTIPRESGWLYRVQQNETVTDIAARFGASPDEVLTASMLSTSAVVRPGELLFIPNHLVLPKAE